MNDTAIKTEPTVRTEWGHQITWPDGHTEYCRDDTRAAAESYAHMSTRRGRKSIVVTRTVTTTPWTQV